MKPGALHRQLHKAAETVRSLPDWMRGESMTPLEAAVKSNERLEGTMRALKIKHDQLQRHINTLERMDAILSGRTIKRITVVIADAEDPSKDSGVGLKPEEFPELIEDIKKLVAEYRVRAEANLQKFLQEEAV